MQKVILHIPHSSTIVPFKNGYLVTDDALNKEILKLTDWYTDELFHSGNDIIIKAEFSRIFCDVERFADDSKEVMAPFGMGVLYEKTDTGESLRQVDTKLRDIIFKNYYWKHHAELSEAVKNQLDNSGKALIIDCHSFPDIPLNRSLNKDFNRPDFNIGTDKFHTPNKLIDTAIDFFNKKGYSLGIDWPYTGSIVPIEYYQKNKNVHSIMLEINRALYLKESTNQKSENYLKTRDVVIQFVQAIKSCFN